jgi:alcohol dehydrogenase/L-iditol 2-dehydrogenase
VLAATSPAHLLVIGLPSDARRLEIAHQYGASQTYVTPDEDPVAAVRALEDGLGADLVVDAAGVSETLETAMQLVRPAGQIAKVGWGRAPFERSLDPLVQKAARIQGSFSHTWGTWERVLRLLGNGTLNVKPLFRRYPLAEWREAFAAMERGDIAKAVLIP